MLFSGWRTSVLVLFSALLPVPFQDLGAAESSPPAEATIVTAQVGRGKLLYLQHCVICHQGNGQGSPGTFPPLAKSDYLLGDKKRGILALVQGLSDQITVNGVPYHGAMPPMVLDDARVADVLTFVRNSFGNRADAVTPDEVKAVRAKSRFPTYKMLVQAAAYPPLPAAPEGFAVREVVKLLDHGTRLAGDVSGRSLYLLGGGGDVSRIDIASGKITPVLRGKDYLREAGTTAFAFDGERRLYIIANHRNEHGALVTNEVTIYRTTEFKAGEPAKPEAWFRTSYPWGIGPFNHGVGHAAFGPDGLLYVGSGSRTDGNEPGGDAHYFQGGEVPITACIWRLDPRAARPEIEIFARGLRNTYGFCWNDRGEMFATDNGPDADAPEELNLVEQGRHYGFPYQFSDWTNRPYAYTPDAPPGIQFTRPIQNRGPAAGGSEGRPLYSFDAHSSPAGIAFLGENFPAPHRGTLLVTRFGNLLKKPVDAGYDLVQVRLQKDGEGRYQSRMTTLLAPLGRPLDVYVSSRGRIYVLEYTRQTDNKAEFGMLPGRILELSVKK